MRHRETLLVALLALAWAFLAPAGRILAQGQGQGQGQGQEDKDLAKKAFQVLNNYCARCHHGPKPKSEVEDYDVLDRASLTKARRDEDKNPFAYITPKDPKKSLIWKRVSEGSMPPQKVKMRPSEADKEVLKKWIEAGAPPFPPAPRPKPE
jgi:hypothetical protein